MDPYMKESFCDTTFITSLDLIMLRLIRRVALAFLKSLCDCDPCQYQKVKYDYFLKFP